MTPRFKLYNSNRAYAFLSFRQVSLCTGSCSLRTHFSTRIVGALANNESRLVMS